MLICYYVFKNYSVFKKYSVFKITLSLSRVYHRVCLIPYRHYP